MIKFSESFYLKNQIDKWYHLFILCLLSIILDIHTGQNVLTKKHLILDIN